MKVAITGGHGFLGWHTACRLLATRGLEAVLLGRSDFGDAAALADRLRSVDVVIHVAGVNRAEDPADVEHGNVAIAEMLRAALADRPVHVVYANSVQAEADNPYGRGKAKAADILRRCPGTLADVRLPNLFGEHGRPGYNSFVATFADAVAHGRRPTVTGDRQIALLHAQDAAEVLLQAAEKPTDAQWTPSGERHGISEVLELMETFHALYAKTGELPALSTRFRRDLFNTYRAALWPDAYPFHPRLNSDARGDLIEVFRSHGGTGQGYLSSTKPGQTRGEHYHLRKVERFVVFSGEAEIAVRRLFSDEVVRLRVSGARPSIVDMPTMWTHNIRNVGDSDVITAFWSDQLLDPADPDQYPLKVGEAP